MIFKVLKFPKVRYIQVKWKIKPPFDGMLTQ